MTVAALDIEAAGLGYAGAPPALANVRLRIARGERVAILGSNGAGKSTLLRAGVGLGRVTGGTVRVLGMLVRSPEEAILAGAGLVLQNPEDQILGATVLEDALIGPLHAGHDAQAARARALDALDAVGLSGFEDRAIERLSFGEKRRAGLAGVLAMEPTLFLLDEPTSGLDPLGEREIVLLLSRVARERGATLLVATHDVDLVPELADRAVVLGEGRILADGPMHEIFADKALLARARLRAPRVAELWRVLGRDGRAPLTLQEALAWNGDRS